MNFKQSLQNILKKINLSKINQRNINFNQLSHKINLRLIAIIVLMVLAISLTLTTYAALTTSQTVSSAGGINVSANLSVYSDSAFQNNLTSINWGTPTPGTNVTKTIYIKNTGAGVSLALSMSTSSWNPSNANGPISLTWDQEGKRLNPGQSTMAQITLAVSPTIVDITSFNVQISITGTQ